MDHRQRAPRACPVLVKSRIVHGIHLGSNPDFEFEARGLWSLAFFDDHRQGCLCHGHAGMPVSRTGKMTCVTDRRGCLCHGQAR